MVLHEALTGNVPYSSLQPNILKSEIVRGAKSSPKIGEDVRRICEKSLQRDPSKRHSSAVQMASELRKTLDRPTKRNRWLWTMPVLLILGGLGTSWLWPRKGVVAHEAGSIHFDGEHRIVTPVDRFMPSTLEAWVKPEDLVGTQFFVSSDSYGEYGLGLGVHGGLPHAIFLSGADVGRQPMIVGQWSHVAVVFSPTESRLYLNGKRLWTGPESEMFGEGIPYVVGGVGLDSRVFQFKGGMKAVRISEGERYGDDFTPAEALEPDETTVLLYDGNHLEGQRVIDQSGRGNHGKWELSLPSMPPPTLPKYGIPSRSP